MTARLEWGILGTGSIAGAFARGLLQSRSGSLRAVGSRNVATAESFAAEHGASTVHGSYDGLLADPEVEAVYISTPHPMHAEWAVKAADAGKHILCEKPMTLNHPDATQVVEAARRNDVFLMEAFMYRCNPQTARLVELIRDGAIGEVRAIRAEFGFRAKRNPAHRLFRHELGGGGILDVGCYPISMSRLVAGAAVGRPFLDPVEIAGWGRAPGDSRVDEWAAATLRFEPGIVAQVACGIQLQLENQAVVFGSEGRIVVPAPWICNGREPGTTTLVLHRAGAEPEDIRIPVDRGIYAIEADTVAEHLSARQAPAMGWDDTLGNMKTLDRWRRSAGVEYDGESAAAYRRTIDGRPLRKRPGAPIPSGTLAGFDKPVSRLVMGTDTVRTIADASARFDDFFARGGNTFDSAYNYCGGTAERMLGQWIENRGIRDETVVVTKGAHTPFCNPEALLRQFDESLERLRTDHVDIYFMHRDNPEIPVGEFMDVLNELHDAGRIGLFGGSNWSIERVEAATAWAKAHGKQGFAAVSNNFSLARMVNPMWKNCVASSEPEWKAWHAATQMPLFAWSSQARGFFVPGRAAPDRQDDARMVNAWYREDNFERQARCFELASKKNVHPVNIALAFVLHQPFPVYPLVGPASIQETVSTLQGLEVKLTDAECRWLDLESDSPSG